MLLQMARFHSFLWLSNIPVYTCIYTSSLTIHLLMGTQICSIKEAFFKWWVVAHQWVVNSIQWVVNSIFTYQSNLIENNSFPLSLRTLFRTLEHFNSNLPTLNFHMIVVQNFHFPSVIPHWGLCVCVCVFYILHCVYMLHCIIYICI